MLALITTGCRVHTSPLIVCAALALFTYSFLMNHEGHHHEHAVHASSDDGGAMQM